MVGKDVAKSKRRKGVENWKCSLVA